MTDIRLIAIDIDGTLLTPTHELSPRTETALKKAQEQGVLVILATGKTPFSAREFVTRLSLRTPGIYVQGTAIYDADGTPRHQQGLSADLARQIITFAEDRGFHVALYSGAKVLMRKLSGHEKMLTSRHEPLPEVVGPLQNLLDEFPVSKLIIFQNPEGQKLPSLRWQINAQVNGAVSMVMVEDQLEVLPPGVSKGAALKTLLRELKIPAEQVLAIGDHDNDLEMLQLAGISVAMGNATPKIKQAAKHIVASNAEDGVAEALERFVLKTEVQPALPNTPTTNEGAGS